MNKVFEEPFPVAVLSGYVTSGGTPLYSWQEKQRSTLTGNFTSGPMPRLGVGNLTEINNYNFSGQFPFNADIRLEGFTSGNPMYLFNAGLPKGAFFEYSGNLVTSVFCSGGGIGYTTIFLDIQFSGGALVSGYVNYSGYTSG